MVRKYRYPGFTLIEMLVVMALIGFLALIAVPYTQSWLHEADVRQGVAQLRSAYGKAKAVALRNPLGAVEAAPAAGLRFVNDLLVVCEGTTTHADCVANGAVNGSRVVWRSAFPTGLSVMINDAALSGYDLDNTGQSVDGSGAIQSLEYTVSKGNQSDDGQLR